MFYVVRTCLFCLILINVTYAVLNSLEQRFGHFSLYITELPMATVQDIFQLFIVHLLSCPFNRPNRPHVSHEFAC